MTGWEAAVVLGVLAAIALLAPLFGADTRPGVDRASEGGWQHRG